MSATWVALALAIIINVFYYATGNDLTVVVSRTLFADMILVLSLVPVYEAIRVRHSDEVLDIPARIRSGMKPVALYTFLLAIVTFILFSLFADPLVAAKLNTLTEYAQTAVENGEITQKVADERLKAMESFYSIGFFLPIVLLVNLFAGFVSSIPAALLIRK